MKSFLVPSLRYGKRDPHREQRCAAPGVQRKRAPPAFELLQRSYGNAAITRAAQTGELTGVLAPSPVRQAEEPPREIVFTEPLVITAQPPRAGNLESAAAKPTAEEMRSAQGQEREAEQVRENEAAAGTARREAEGETAKAGDEAAAKAGQEVAEEARRPPGAGAPPEKPPAGIDETRAPSEVPAPGEDEPDPMANWRSGVRGAIARVPDPPIVGVDQARVRILAAGAGATARQTARRAGIQGSAKRAVPKAPEPADPPPVPPEPDPLPEATALVTAKSDRELPPQTLPALRKSPMQNIPVEGNLGALSEAEGFDQAAHEREMEELRLKGRQKAAGKEEQKEDPNRKRAEQVRKKNAEKKPEPSEQPGQAVEIKDEPVRPARAIKGVERQTIAGALAQLLENPQAEADRMMNDAREQAYPNRVLVLVYPDIGKDRRDGLKSELEQELERVRAEAGVSKEMLDQKIAERKAELAKRAGQEQAQNAQAHNAEAANVKAEGQKNLDTIAGTAAAMRTQAGQTVEQSGGGADPALIQQKRDAQIGRLHELLGRQLGLYEQKGSRRGQALDLAGAKQIAAYMDTGEREARQVVREAGEDAAKKSAALLQAQTFRAWAAERVREVRNLVGRYKREANGTAAIYQGELRQAGQQAVEKVRAWADERMGRQRSWWQRFFDTLKDWFGLATAAAEQWQVVNAQETRDSILRDAGDLQSLLKQAQEGVDLGQLAAQGRLTAEQLTILQAFFGEGPDRLNPLAAIAAALRLRISRRRRPDLMQRFEEELLATTPSQEDWRKLDDIGASQRPGFNSAKLADNLHAAMHPGLTGLGTEEGEIYAALSNLTPVQSKAIRDKYQLTYGESLRGELKGELSGAEEDRALALLEGRQASADAAALYEAMHGGITGLGTDEEIINQVLRGKSDEERRLIIQEYKRVYHIDLEADLHSELSDYELDQSVNYLHGDVAGGDASGIQQAYKGGWFFGLGTDEKGRDAIYKQIRAEVEQQAIDGKWTPERKEAEILRRNQEVEAKFGAQYAHEYGTTAANALRKANKEELSGPELRLANAQADNDIAAGEAARLDIEFSSVITDDDAVNAIFAAQYERALGDEKLAKLPAMQAKLDRQEELDRQAGNPWPPWRRANEERLLERQLETSAQERSVGYTNRMTEEYEKHDFGPGSLQFRLYMTTSGVDRDQALMRLKQGGYLSPAQKITYAIRGLGTKEDLFNEAIEGRTFKEIQEIKEEWKKIPGNEDLDFDKEVMSEFSGREAFDVGQKLKGAPTTPKERLDRELENVQYEMETSNRFASTERRVLEERRKELLESYRELNDPKLDPALRQLRYDAFQRRAEAAQNMVQIHRKQADAATDAIANIAGAVAAVVVVIIAVAVTILTGGTAAPALIGALAALAAGIATISTKAIMKGKAYGAEEFATDVALTAIDVALSAATAGIGDKLLKAGRLAAMAAKGPIRQVLAKVASEVVENTIQAIPNAFARNALDDRLWDSPDTAALMAQGTAMEAVMNVAVSTPASMAMGKVMNKMLGPLAARAALRRSAGELGEVSAEGISREAGDVLGRIGNTEQRLAVWHQYKLENPGAGYLDFRHALESGAITADTIAEAVGKLHKQMRAELLSSIPAVERGLFTETPIRVLSDAEFNTLTGSRSANAFVMVDGDKFTVVIRESAPLGALREEGIHLHQSLDPANAAKFAQLDEAKMSRWHELPLDEQLGSYRSKLDLEIDAQRRLIADLDAAAKQAGDDPGTLDQIGRRRADAEATLDNLNRRMGEVEALTPERRLSIDRKEEARPQFLEEPARLFHKHDQGKAAVLKALSGDAVKEAETILNKISAREMNSPGATGMFEQVAKTAQSMSKNPAEVLDFLKSVNHLLEGQPRNTAAVADAVLAAGRSGNPAQVMKDLAAVAGGPRESVKVSDKTLAQLAARMKNAVPPELAASMAGSARALVEADAGDWPAFQRSMEEAQKALGNAEGMEQLTRTLAEQNSPVAKTNFAAIDAGYPRDIPAGHRYVRTAEGKFEIEAISGSGKFRLEGEPPKAQIVSKPPADTSFEATRANMAKRNPGPTKFEALENALKDAGKDGWPNEDLGPIRNWSKPLEELHKKLEKSLGKEQADQMLREMLDLLPNSGYSEASYSAFRRKLRERLVDHIFWESPGVVRSVKEQKSLLKDFYNAQPDPRSRGELFSAWQRELSAFQAKNKTSAISVIAKAAQKIDNVPVGTTTKQTSMVDGAVKVDEPVTYDRKGELRTMESGDYAVEDKGSRAAYDHDQARIYSETLKKNGELKLKADGKKEVLARGVITVLPDEKSAKAIAAEMDDDKFDPRIHVAYRDDNGVLVIIR